MKLLQKTGIVLVVLFGMYSCDEVIFVTDISQDRVQIIAPTNDVIIEEGTVSFNWASVHEATEYQVQIATPNFDQAAQVLVDSITQELSYSLDLEANMYQWRVRAINSAYETAYTTNSFTIE